MESTDDESETEDCTAHPEALTIVLFGSREADCKGEDRKAKDYSSEGKLILYAAVRRNLLNLHAHG